ncbi:hypothetical protein LINPERPRIM_LOCUS13635 [Linum perenne]
MKHIFKILALVAAISAFWVGLLQASVVPRTHTWLVSRYQSISLCHWDAMAY